MTNILQSLGFGSTNSILTATLLLRVALGALFLAHAWLKVFVFTPSGAAQYFASLGVPGVMAYVTIAAEVLGGFALILGFQTSLVALLLIPVLLGAAILAHGPNGFWFTNEGGGWEYPAFWALALLVQSLLGGGLLAITKG
ncbi:DoxX family protein [Salipiger sp. PrR002]|uniref:DoxX family protein n=1 Tax=Salipiger sp. PrR002 TaxID=2706489 RepID=UPI0013BCD5EC|nr:DoxX family protein [Salipiger sp. PrR002]NDV99433.1 DoxX family protein [Salipiger sp. PrR002]NDW58691.1 DoxX family protein [Salipiger sp. PrR004]